MNKNNLKERLMTGKQAIGVWNTISSPVVTDVLASTGVDFVFIDFEHGPFDLKNILSYTNACLSYGVTPIVRIPRAEEWMVQQALDQGAQGIIAPHIETLDQANNFSNSLRFYPQGNRGFTPYSKAGNYTAESIENFITSSNEGVLSFAIVESLEGLNNIEDISSCENLDAIFFGSFDISQSMGMPGMTRDPAVVQKIGEANKIAKENGKYTGGYLLNSENDIDWVKQFNFNFLIYGVDSFLLKNTLTAAVSYFRGR